MPSTVAKNCVVCAKDVRSLQRTKDDAGNYYCRSCWEQQSSVSNTTSQINTTQPFEQSDADVLQYREQRQIRFIVSTGIVVGLAITITLLYILFVRDWWEGRLRTQLFAAKARAESLVVSCKLDAANDVFTQLSRDFGEHSFRDADTNRQLRMATSEAKEVSNAISKRDSARALVETSYEDEVARAQKIKSDAKSDKDQLTERQEQSWKEQSVAFHAFDGDPVVDGLIDQYPEFEIPFKQRERARISSTLTALLASGNVSYSTVKHVDGLFDAVDESKRQTVSISETIAKAQAILDAPMPSKPIVNDADFIPKTLIDSLSSTGQSPHESGDTAIPVSSTKPTVVVPVSKELAQKHPIEAMAAAKPPYEPTPSTKSSTEAVVPTTPPANLPKASSNSGEESQAAENQLVGDWQDGGLLMSVRHDASGLTMSQPKKGYYSTRSKIENGSVFFYWSNHHEIMVFRLTSSSAATLTCYDPSAASALEADKSMLPAPKWQRKMKLVTSSTAP